MNLTVNWCFLLRACELMHIFHAGRKSAVIMLTALSATVENLVHQVPGIVHPCFDLAKFFVNWL
jgi:hypothetical protein